MSRTADKFQIGDYVRNINKGRSLGTHYEWYDSEGYIMGIVNGFSPLYIVNWIKGPGVKNQEQLGRYCRHYGKSLEIISNLTSNIPEPLDNDLI